MRLRERASASGRTVDPPLSLRRFGDVYTGGQGFGQDVYAGRGEWVTARHAWQAENGLTMEQWWGLLLADARYNADHGGGLASLNEPFSDFWLIESDEDDDPRLLTEEQQRERHEAFVRESRAARGLVTP